MPVVTIEYKYAAEDAWLLFAELPESAMLSDTLTEVDRFLTDNPAPDRDGLYACYRITFAGAAPFDHMYANVYGTKDY